MGMLAGLKSLNLTGCPNVPVELTFPPGLEKLVLRGCRRPPDRWTSSLPPTLKLLDVTDSGWQLIDFAHLAESVPDLQLLRLEDDNHDRNFAHAHLSSFFPRTSLDLRRRSRK
jgi:hypothetical protein